MRRVQRRSGQALRGMIIGVLGLGLLGLGPPSSPAGGPPADRGPDPACGQIEALTATEVDEAGVVTVTAVLADDACGSVLYALGFDVDEHEPVVVHGGDEHGTTIIFEADVPDGATQAEVTTTFTPPGRARGNPHTGRELDSGTVDLTFPEPVACDVGRDATVDGHWNGEVHFAQTEGGTVTRIALGLYVDHDACQGASFGWVHFEDGLPDVDPNDPNAILHHDDVGHTEFRPIDATHEDVDVTPDGSGELAGFAVDDLSLVGGCIAVLAKDTVTGEAFFVATTDGPTGSVICPWAAPPGDDHGVSPFF